MRMPRVNMRAESGWSFASLLGGILVLGVLAQPCAMAMTAADRGCGHCLEAGLTEQQACADHQSCLQPDTGRSVSWALAYAESDESPGSASSPYSHAAWHLTMSAAAHSWCRTDTVPRGASVPLPIRYCVFLK